MVLEVLKDLIYLHQEFFHHYLKLAQLDLQLISALPSLIFFVFGFILFHNFFHKRTGYYTPLRVVLHREAKLQTAFLYVTKLWYLVLHGCRELIMWLEQHLMILHSQKRLLWLDHLQIRTSIFTVLTTLSFIPVTVLILNCLWRHNIPNFLIWVGEDPWVRSEIGTSGRYLIRPVRFTNPKRKEYPYRFRRSRSADLSNAPTHPPLVRLCKSLEEVVKRASFVDASVP